MHETQRKPQVGDTVHVVCFTRAHDRVHREAKVEKVREGDLVDVLIPGEDGAPGTEQRLRCSPRDNSGAKPDCWHFPEVPAQTV